ncbi:MAG: hypothetical protein HY364_02445 [Candidatus Aenigmarchaeota archaeon]|nr:hypothetical protein [Candidatus Aenigmarchaeota archaeon]
MKGQDPLLGHVISTAFSAAMIIAVIAITVHLKETHQEFIGGMEADEVCSMIRSSAGKFVFEANYLSPNNTASGRVYVNLPKAIGGEPYRIRFIGRNASIESGIVNTTCVIGYNATYLGSVAGGRAKMEVSRTAQGSMVVEMASA